MTDSTGRMAARGSTGLQRPSRRARTRSRRARTPRASRAPSFPESAAVPGPARTTPAQVSPAAAASIRLRLTRPADPMTGADQLQSEEPPAKRGRGRPKGSKNKPKLEPHAGAGTSYTFSSVPGSAGPYPRRTARAIASAASDPDEEDSVHLLGDAGEHGHGPARSMPELSFAGKPISGSGPQASSSAIPLSSSFSIDPALVSSLEDTDAGTENTPPHVQARFNKYRETYLKRDLGSDMPRLYAALHSFWIPQESNIFDRTAHSAVNIYQGLRFFLWDPLPLAPEGIPCPNDTCLNTLQRYGDAYHLRKIVDLNNAYWLIGTRYHCVSCGKASGSSSAVTSVFISWDQRIVTALPAEVSREFPLHVTHHEGIDKTLFAFLQVCFSHGLGVRYFSDAICTHHARNAGAGGTPVMHLSGSGGGAAPSFASAERPLSAAGLHAQQQQQSVAGPSSAFDIRFPDEAMMSKPEDSMHLHHVGDPSSSASASALQPAFEQQQQQQQQQPPAAHPTWNFIPQTPHPTSSSTTPLHFQVFESTRTSPQNQTQTQQIQVFGRTSTRKPRTCRKCGRTGISVSPTGMGCAGASDVRSCKNPCRDCGRYDCEGRDTKRWQGKTPCRNFLSGAGVGAGAGRTDAQAGVGVGDGR